MTMKTAHKIILLILILLVVLLSVGYLTLFTSSIPDPNNHHDNKSQINQTGISTSKTEPQSQPPTVVVKLEPPSATLPVVSQADKADAASRIAPLLMSSTSAEPSTSVGSSQEPTASQAGKGATASEELPPTKQTLGELLDKTTNSSPTSISTTATESETASSSSSSSLSSSPPPPPPPSEPQPPLPETTSAPPAVAEVSSTTTSTTNAEPASSASPAAPVQQVDMLLNRNEALNVPSEVEIEAWNQFRSAYNRTYLSQEEGNHRQNVFMANYRFIKTFNERAEALFKLDVNQFADLTRDEINSIYVGPQMSWRVTISESQVTVPRHISILADEEADSSLIPSIDWRNVTTEPVNQGTCKESAVFAAVAAVEAAFNAQLMQEQPNVTPVKLSEQQMLDCLTLATPPGGPPVCLGFLPMERVFGLIQGQQSGLASAQNYLEFLRQRAPGAVGGPQPPICHMPPGDLKRAKLDSFSMINQKDLPEALLNKGSVVVAIDATQPTFHFYKSGLYHDLNCSPDTFNLHVLLVGYSAGSDASSRDRPFYLARNSFGPHWGENGHFRMLKDEQRNKCLPQNFGIYPTLASH